MKQVININFQGRVVPIEVTAFDILKNYTESLNGHFANEEGKEEIINDIESRIGELFQERLKNGATCITDDDVNAVISSIGRPEDLGSMDDAQSSASASSFSQRQQSPSGSNLFTGQKRLYRDENNKVIGGVCAGLANYFNMDIIVVRIIFLVLMFFFGFGFLPYIIMWIAVPSSASNKLGSAKKKLFRDTDDKLIAGVCSGIGNYFGVNAWIPRAVFLLPFLSFLSRWDHWGGFWNIGDVIRFTFSPTSLIIYIILWIVIPEAITTSEKLEMKGEKVDMNSIKNSVMEEMKAVGKRAEKFGKEASGYINEKTKSVAGDVQETTRRSRGGLGNAIALIAKIFAYFVIGCVCFGFVMALFGLGIFSVGVFPLKDYILKGEWQNFYAWGTLVLFIAVPIVGIITWLIRRIAKTRGNSKILRLTFGSLWTLGWVCIIILITSVVRDFKSSSSPNDQNVALTNPHASKLLVTTTAPFNIKKYYARNWIRFEPFENLMDDDTAYIRNIYVEIERSPNDSFQVTMRKMARGYDKPEANELASLIKFNVAQSDSLLLLDKGIAINKTDKFRDQLVVVTIYVPLGKQIRIDNSVGNGHVYFGSSRWENNWNNDNYDDEQDMRWQADVDYVMKADGLYTLTGRKADGWGDKEERKQRYKDAGSSYRYDSIEDPLERRMDSIEHRKQLKLDSIERKQQYLKDSIDRQIEREKNKIENSNSAIEDDDGPLSGTVTLGVDIFSVI